MSPKEHPAGTRFIYRNSGGTFILEDLVLEWSGSGAFVKLKQAGWMSAKDAASRIVFLEALEPLSADISQLCYSLEVP